MLFDFLNDYLSIIIFLAIALILSAVAIPFLRNSLSTPSPPVQPLCGSAYGRTSISVDPIYCSFLTATISTP